MPNWELTFNLQTGSTVLHTQFEGGRTTLGGPIILPSLLNSLIVYLASSTSILQPS